MKELIKQLIEHEGIELKPYKCPAGYWTIGVGRNLQENGISEVEAMILLMNDIERCQGEVDTAMPFAQSLSKARYNVLINMCFNMGISRLLGFRKMSAALRRGDYAGAAIEGLDSRWARQVGDRAVELMKIMKEGR